MPNPRPKKRLLGGGQITHISLLPGGVEGAIGLRPLYKTTDTGFEIAASVAKVDEKGLLYTVAYPLRKTDSHGDIAETEEVVEDFAHSFLREGGNNVDLLHDFRKVGDDAAHIAESFIIQKGDPRFQGVRRTDTGELFDPTGSWGVVIKLNDEGLRKEAREGRMQVSMAGTTFTEEIKSFDKALADRLGNTPNGDFDMDEQKLADLIAKALQPVNEAVTKLAEANKTSGDEPAEKPVIKFEGDASNKEDLRKHEEKLFLNECDLTTLEGLKKWERYLDERTKTNEPKEESEEDKSEDKAKTAEIASLEKKLADLRKSSNVKSSDDAIDSGKSETQKMAEAIQKGRQLGRAARGEKENS